MLLLAVAERDKRRNAHRTIGQKLGRTIVLDTLRFAKSEKTYKIHVIIVLRGIMDTDGRAILHFAFR